MKRVGVREAKNRLSHLLREVQRGREWVITERGVPVARLVPIAGEVLPLEERLKRLELAGELEPARAGHGRLAPPLALEGGMAQRFLSEDRGA